MRTTRYILMTLCLTISLIFLYEIRRAVNSADTIRDFVPVRFDVPEEYIVEVDGESVHRIIYLSNKETYDIVFREDGKVVRQFTYSPTPGINEIR